MDETQVANAMVAGEIASPHRFANLWLFKVRVTGTGVAERPSLNEVAYRNPDDYLNPHFLDRCSGLPVVLQHPVGPMLTPTDFAQRTIGTLTRAYVDGNEVWAIAKVWDDAAAAFMRENQLSTSPGVVFIDPSVNETQRLGDGRNVLIEGKPALLDHLAICSLGVWDKGGSPMGVDITGATETQMITTNQTPADSEVMTSIKALLTGLSGLTETIGTIGGRLDGVTSRLDSMEDERRADAEASEERRQAAELEKIAKEEDEEADKLEREDARLDRKDGESCEDHSARVDAMVKKFDGKHFGRRDSETEKEHSERMDAVCAMRRDRRDNTMIGTPTEPVRTDKRKDAEDEEAKMRADEKEEEAPDDAADRKDGEGDVAYSGRMDSVARRYELNHLIRRPGERVSGHLRRLDAFGKRMQVRKDARDKDNTITKLLDEVTAMRGQLGTINARIEDRPDADITALSAAQARADEVYGTLSAHAPRPLLGETLIAYRLRIARDLQQHSPIWKDSNLAEIARVDSTAFGNAEGMIYADARTFGLNPATVGVGQLREIRRNIGGREVTEFSGDPAGWMNAFMPPRAIASELRTKFN